MSVEDNVRAMLHLITGDVRGSGSGLMAGPAGSSVNLYKNARTAAIIAKAWKDPDYKSRLIQNPKAVLRNELYEIDPSITLPDALNVQVHEETADLFHLVLPRNPTDIKLSEVIGDNLEGVAPPQVMVMPEWATAPGIQALGVGEKETNGALLSDVALKVYVKKKLPNAQLDRPVPKLVSMGDLHNIVTDVVEVGDIQLQSNTLRVRPALPGYSVSRAGDQPDTGTFGMVVRKKGHTSPFYLLSNCHAIAASGLASKGDVIIQPGAADGGVVGSDRIGTLVEWVPFDFTPGSTKNTVDAAIAQLDPDVASAAIAQLGVPTGVNTTLTRRMYLQKVGRTTNLSVARVTDVDLVLSPLYPTASGQQPVMLRDQVLVTFYSAGGDSGSGVLDMDDQVVGLHVGGSDVVGFFCKIANVLDRLGIEVVTKDNIGCY